MKKFAKILSVLLCLAMLAGMIAVVASAEEVNATVWTKVSLADIQPTDTIAITMSKGDDTYVLPTTGNGSSKQPLGNDVVVSSVTDTTLTTVDGEVGCGWTITATTGGYYIMSGESYLYLTAATNGMRIGSTAAVWTVADNGYLCSVDSKDAVRYLGVYTGAPDWRCYTANDDGSMKDNIAGQTVTFWKKTGTTTVTVVELEPITIADARKAADDTEVAVSGTVTYVNGKNVTIQDDTGAIVLYFASDNHGFAAGDVLDATGTKSTYGQIHQLSGAKAEKTGTKTLTPAETTISGITVDKLGQYIKLSGVEVTEVYDNNGKYTTPNVTVKDSDGKTIQIYKAVVDKNTDGSWAVKVGDTVDVSAVIAIYQKTAQNASGQYELTGEYTLQLNNNVASEIVVTEKAPAGDDGNGGEETTPTTVTIADGTYLIHNGTNGMVALNETYNYGYAPNVALTIGDSISGYENTAIFTITNTADGKFTITDVYGKMLYMTGSYSSFNVGKNPTEGHEWILEDAGDGNVYLKNVSTGKYVAYSTSYGTWGAYASISETSVLSLTAAKAAANPDTGDTTISVAVALLVLSGIGAAALVAKKKEF